MRIDLYQIETVRIATEQTALLDEAQQIIMSGNKLSRLEQSGVLHAWHPDRKWLCVDRKFQR